MSDSPTSDPSLANPGTSSSPRIWVDADAMPREVREILFRAAARLELETILVSNQRIPTPPGNGHVRTVRVAFGPDVADHHVVAEARPGDLAVTADIPLAAALVEKGVKVVDPRGEEYDAGNVGERLSIRDFMTSLRDVGVETGGPKPYTARDRHAFAAALDRILTALLRSAPPPPPRNRPSGDAPPGSPEP